MKPLLLVATIFNLSGQSAANDNPFNDVRTYDRSAFSRTVTECDRLARHPLDPESLLEGGLTQCTMDKPAAIQACLKDLEADPDNPRLNYQLSRAYGHGGDQLKKPGPLWVPRLFIDCGSPHHS